MIDGRKESLTSRMEESGATYDPDHALEDALRVALRHVDSPEGFAGRLLTRAIDEQAQLLQRKRVLWPIRRFALPVAFAAALLLLVGSLGSVAASRHRHNERREQATHNFELATRIEERTLAHTRQQLRDAGISVDR